MTEEAAKVISETQDGGSSTEESSTSTDTKADDKAAQTSDSATDKAAEGSDSATDKAKDKALPYDKDPKWLKARAAEKVLESILSDHEYDSPEDLVKALQSGKSLKELIGAKDAKKLLKDSETLKMYEDHWDQEEKDKKRDEESADETIKRLEGDNKNLKEGQRKEKEDRDFQKAQKKALKRYGDEVSKHLDREGIPKDEAEVLKLHLGVDNPFNKVDLEDPKAVKEMIADSSKQFLKSIKAIKQQAVDEYAAGKSKIVPITGAEPDSVTTTTKRKLPDDATIEDHFADANAEILELVEQVSKSG